MPGLTDAEWAVVSTSASLRDLKPEQGVLALRTKIASALKQHVLLTDDDAVADVARRAHVDIGVLQDWAVVGESTDRNNRYEVDIRRSFRMVNGALLEGFINKVVHCSKRHLKDEYYLAHAEEAYSSEALNTIAYCTASSFTSGLDYYAQQVAAYLNAWERTRARDPRGVRKPLPSYKLMPRYAARHGEPEFQADSGPGNTVHCFCIDTPNVAVTLDLATHAKLKTVLRGIYAPDKLKSNVVKDWRSIADVALVQQIIPAYERESISRAIAARGP
jgi:uncharacterized protein YfkK (UPF0435 family)